MSALRITSELEDVQVREQGYQVVSPAPRKTWVEVLRSDPNALVSQSPEWLDCLCSQNGCEDASRLYEFSDGQRIILPLVRKTALFGLLNTAASFQTGWGMGGVISSRPIRAKEMQAVVNDLSDLKDIQTIVRPNPLKAREWEAALTARAIAAPKLAHVLNLQGGFTYVWEKRFKGVTRTAIRKAEKNGVVVEHDTSGKLLPTYYQLFEQSLERWGRNQHEPLALARWRGKRRDPYTKFQRWAQFLGEALHIWVAYVNNEPAAAILVLQGKNANYTRGAMNKSLAGPKRANDLLHSLAIREACEAGCHYYHMGETGESASLAAFKSNFGAQPVSYAEYYFQRLPLFQVDRWARSSVKRMIGFKDA